MATTILVGGLLLIIFACVYFFLLGGTNKFLAKTLQKNYKGIEIHNSKQDGDVEIIYHTYRGFLLYFTQDEHSFLCTTR